MDIQDMPMGTVEVFSSTFVRVVTVKSSLDLASVVYKRVNSDDVVLEIVLNGRGESEIKLLDKFFWNLSKDGLPTTEAEMSRQTEPLEFDIGADNRVINFRSKK